MTISLSVLVYNYENSAMHYRATNLFKYFDVNRFKISINIRRKYKMNNSILNNVFDFLFFTWLLFKQKPHIIYIFEINLPATLATIIYTFFNDGIKILLDVGDIPYTEIKKYYSCSIFKKTLIFLSQYLSFKISDTIIVRSIYFKEYLKSLNKKISVIPDCINFNNIQIKTNKYLKHDLGLDSCVCMGFLGSLVYYKNGTVPGLELIELIKLFKNNPKTKFKIKGLIIGDGPGLNVLKEKTKKYGLQKDIIFFGRIPYEQLYDYLDLFDIALVTLPDTPEAKTKTTGKFTEYLARGRFIVSSNIGIIADTIKQYGNGLTIEYSGLYDKEYPQKIYSVILPLLQQKSLTYFKLKGLIGKKIAKKYYTYEASSKHLSEIIENI